MSAVACSALVLPTSLATRPGGGENWASATSGYRLSNCLSISDWASWSLASSNKPVCADALGKLFLAISSRSLSMRARPSIIIVQCLSRPFIDRWCAKVPVTVLGLADMQASREHSPTPDHEERGWIRISTSVLFAIGTAVTLICVKLDRPMARCRWHMKAERALSLSTIKDGPSIDYASLDAPSQSGSCFRAQVSCFWLPDCLYERGRCGSLSTESAGSAWWPTPA